MENKLGDPVPFNYRFKQGHAWNVRSQYQVFELSPRMKSCTTTRASLGRRECDVFSSSLRPAGIALFARCLRTTMFVGRDMELVAGAELGPS